MDSNHLSSINLEINSVELPVSQLPVTPQRSSRLVVVCDASGSSPALYSGFANINQYDCSSFERAGRLAQNTLSLAKGNKPQCLQTAGR